MSIKKRIQAFLIHEKFCKQCLLLTITFEFIQMKNSGREQINSTSLMALNFTLWKFLRERFTMARRRYLI